MSIWKLAYVASPLINDSMRGTVSIFPLRDIVCMYIST